MSAPLSEIPVARRRRAAATLGLFAVLFTAVGAVSATGRHSAAAPVFAGIAIAVAVLLALIAWGVVHSVALDESNSQLDAAIEATVAAHGGLSCDCGHAHDPSELHVDAGESCAHDGRGAGCSHDCDTCVLAALRPSPTTPRTERTLAE